MKAYVNAGVKFQRISRNLWLSVYNLRLLMRRSAAARSGLLKCQFYNYLTWKFSPISTIETNFWPVFFGAEWNVMKWRDKLNFASWEIENCQVPCKVALKMFVEKCLFLMPVASKVILYKSRGEVSLLVQYTTDTFGLP